MRVISAKNVTRSPTSTGCLNVNELTATVATRPRARRAASTPPAMSTCDMIQPPKMSPCWLTSAGIGTTRSTGSRLGNTLDEFLARDLAQLAPEDLADVRLRQLVAEHHVARALVAGQVLAAVLHDVAGGERGILLDDVQAHRLARLLVRHADRRALEHARMRRDDRLDLVRVHVEARHQDHVLLAVYDADEAALVHDADVAAHEIAVGRHHLRRLVGAVPVAGHH